MFALSDLLDCTGNVVHIRLRHTGVCTTMLYTVHATLTLAKWYATICTRYPRIDKLYLISPMSQEFYNIRVHVLSS